MLKSLGNKWLLLSLWIVIIQGFSAFMGFITRHNLKSWYLSINRSPLTPDGYIFGIVWPILYLLIAIAGWMIWQSDVRHKKQLQLLFATQMILNWLWTPVFFQFHWVLAAWLMIITLIILLIILMYQAENLVIKLLLLPYLIWSLFACYLNGYIAYMN